MSRRPASFWPQAGRSAASSIFWRRNSTANRTRLCAKSNARRVTAIGLELKDGHRPVPRAGAECGVDDGEIDHMSPASPRRGLMLVLSSPSGAGKSTIARKLLESDPRCSPVGQRHHAPAPRQRDRRRALPLHRAATSSSACATATRCSNGPRCTAISTARRASRSRRRMAEGRDMLFDIDWQGAQQLQEQDARRRRVDLHPAAVDGRAEARG